MLTGTVGVHETSETATDAKVKAINFARRKIIYSVLSSYSDATSLNELMQNTSSDELVDLVASSSVSDEQISNDSYSAKITMNLDNDAVKKWLAQNGIQNWVPSAESAERFSMFIVVPNGIADWAELKRAARENKVELETQSMNGKKVIAKMPVANRAKFTATIREMGWKYTDNGGVLQIWK